MDHFDKNEFIIKHCNTSAMLSDFFTKPLQGWIWWRLREVIMVLGHVDILQDYIPPPKKERVENNVYGDKPEINQKVTYAKIVTGSRIRSAHGSWW